MGRGLSSLLGHVLRRRRSTDGDTACRHRGTHPGHHRTSFFYYHKNEINENSTNCSPQFAVVSCFYTALVIQKSSVITPNSLCLFTARLARLAIALVIRQATGRTTNDEMFRIRVVCFLPSREHARVPR